MAKQSNGRLSSPQELEALRASIIEDRDAQKPCITVCGGTGCHSFGSEGVTEAFAQEIKRQKLGDKIDIKVTGCHGFCEKGPVVVIKPKNIFYQQVKAEDISEIVSETVVKGNIVDRLLYTDPSTGKKITYEHEVPFYKEQKRLVFGSNGLIDPNVIEDYLAIGGYAAMAKALSMKPEGVTAEVKKAGLRGRGGGGFPTAMKWETCRNAEGDTKYIICNCDEGDPGAFMDRSLMEGNPHSVLEGMVIGAYAIGGHEGYIYVRNEYPLAVKNARIAIEQAEKLGLLGKNILGSGFDFSVKISRGGGAFVCGESTALMASLEGKVGEPRAKYVHTSEKGLWEQPTNLNNVETWANVPLIIKNGADWYARIGSQGSKGTKIFSLVGKINNTGLIEVPMGVTLKDIIYGIGGGIPEGKKFKAVQTGGPSGGCIPESHLDLPVDFDELDKAGSMMGSGGMIIMDENTCMVDIAKYFVNFLEGESCGKCLPCREGLKRMSQILTDITEGRGKEGDIELLERLSATLIDTSLCALGSTAPNPVLTTLRYFRDEYEAHIKEKRCPAGVCKELVTYSIDKKKCPGCGLCVKACPSGAITDMGKKKPVVLDQEKCIKCGACYDVCKLGAVIRK
ncbi:MAG: NADH-ubiquinone oxidoreductase-F iron-sulfur binding region domain-containing protein [Dehalococcoidia bacterium]|jgi:NADH-quinone oxidoreductase subunit F